MFLALYGLHGHGSLNGGKMRSVKSQRAQNLDLFVKTNLDGFEI